MNEIVKGLSKGILEGAGALMKSALQNGDKVLIRVLDAFGNIIQLRIFKNGNWCMWFFRNR